MSNDCLECFFLIRINLLSQTGRLVLINKIPGRALDQINQTTLTIVHKPIEIIDSQQGGVNCMTLQIRVKNR